MQTICPTESESAFYFSLKNFFIKCFDYISPPQLLSYFPYLPTHTIFCILFLKKSQQKLKIKTITSPQKIPKQNKLKQNPTKKIYVTDFMLTNYSYA